MVSKCDGKGAGGGDDDNDDDDAAEQRSVQHTTTATTTQHACSPRKQSICVCLCVCALSSCKQKGCVLTQMWPCHLH